MRTYLCIALCMLHSLAAAEEVTWEASGTLTDVDTSAGFISEFPGAAVGVPFRVVVVFETDVPLSDQNDDANGSRYRYSGALISFAVSIGGVEVQRAGEGFESIDLWDSYSLNGFRPPTDGVVIFQGVQSSQPSGFAQVALVMRGPEDLTVVNGPGLPHEPSPMLPALSELVFQFVDESDFIIGDIERVVSITDSDADGIVNNVDGFFNTVFVDESQLFSDNFSDEGIAGASFGSIVARNGLDVSVQNAPATVAGLRVEADGASSTVAELNVCGFPLSLSTGSTMDITCSSLEGDLIAGAATVSLNGFQALLSAPVTAFFTESGGGGFTIAHRGGSGQIEILDEDGEAIGAPLVAGDAPVTIGDDNSNDSDGDNVADTDDVCPDTQIPESVPWSWRGLGLYRWTLDNVDGTFTQRTRGHPSQFNFSTTDTRGCSCRQIIRESQLPKWVKQKNRKYGCSTYVMRRWVEQHAQD